MSDVINRSSNGKERKMKHKMVRTLTFCMAGLMTLVVLMFITGCDPEKVGGGGLLQHYSRATGQYK